jgi:hypothetical protein
LSFSLLQEKYREYKNLSKTEVREQGESGIFDFRLYDVGLFMFLKRV